MKMNKRLFSLFAGLFLAVFILGFASSQLTISSVPELSTSGNSFTFTLSSDINDSATVTVDEIVDGSDTITFNTVNVALIGGISKQVTVGYNSTGFDFEFRGDYDTTLNVQGTSGNSSSTTISFESDNYCESYANEGDLSISDLEIDVVNGFGDENDYWYLFDEIKVEVSVENEGNDDIQDAELEWVLYTTDGKKIMSDDENKIDIDEGDEETFIFNFILDEDIEDFDGEEAVLYFRVVGEIDSKNANDGDLSCVYDSEEVEVVTDDDFVILSDFVVNGEDIKDKEFSQSLKSGDQVTITGDVWNIGDNDQDDVMVWIYNKELGIDEEIKVGDIDAFEDDSFSFSFEIPTGVESKKYDLDLEVYDEDNDLYENDENDESIFKISLNIVGKDSSIDAPFVSAKLDSEAKSGENMVVVATITNTEDEIVIVTVNVDGYSDWAEVVSVDPQVMTLSPLGSQEVRIELDVDKDVEGSRTFSVDVLSENEIVTTQPVSVTIEEGKFELLNFISENKKIMGIVLLNLVLLILIIVIAVKILRKK